MTACLYLLVAMSLPLNLDSEIKIREKVESYDINGKIISIVSMSIENNSKDKVWIWLSKNANSLSDEDNVQDYFHSRKNDFSLLQVGMDHNIESFVPELFSSFIKVINPNELFSIDILCGKQMTKKDIKIIYQYLQESIVVIKQKNIYTFIPVLQDFNSMLFFKSMNVIIPFDDLKIQEGALDGVSD